MHCLTLDDFSELAAWSAVVSGQARLELAATVGPTGAALRLEFDFGEGGGFVVARRLLALQLPESFAFRIWVRADAPANAFEFKLIDPSGENVWRFRDEAFAFQSDWRELRISSRELAFGWGPTGGGAPREIGALEIAITAGPGGRGQLWLADLQLEDRTPSQPPLMHASSARAGQDASCVCDGRPDTAWCAEQLPAWLDLDFGQARDYSAILLQWADTEPTACTLLASDDGEQWRTLVTATGTQARQTALYLPDGCSRWLRLALPESADAVPPALIAVDLKAETFARSLDDFVHRLAELAPRGHYPRWLYREQTYWTPLDIPDGTLPALFNEEGAIEVQRAGPLIEPLLTIDGQRVTWAECTVAPSLLQPPLPIPCSTWTSDTWRFEITAFAQGAPGRAWLFIRYRLENFDTAPLTARLQVALRPFQVSPPWQSYQGIGGVAQIERLVWEQGDVRVDERLALVPLSTPCGFEALSLDAQSRREQHQVAATHGLATAALRFEFNLEPHAQHAIWVAAPLGEHEAAHPRELIGMAHAVEAQLNATLTDWAERLGRVQFQLPDCAQVYLHGCQGSLAHILLNRDGAALQPGPRRYTRSWIRDGAVMAAALWRFGLDHEAAAFIDWYAQFQAEDGNVPCCVDRHGIDWLAEHDSHGQFIFAVAEAWRFGGDRARLEALWPAVCRAVNYLEQLRAERLTAHYQAPERRACFGLLPESVSHEGYLAHPVHSYWDDFWAVRGFKDAAELAQVLGDSQRAAQYGRLRDALSAALYVSMERVMDERGIDFLPGSVEWADPDPTATANALTLINETHRLPIAALQRSFDLFMQRFRAVHGVNPVPWTNYTAYEIRIVGALIRLGRRAEAHELLRVYLNERRPAVWNQWPEITWRDPRAPGHQGDLPHAWIGAEYCLVFRDLFVYEREADRSLVIAAGIALDWLAAGAVQVRGLPTRYGRLDLELERFDGGAVQMRISGAVRCPLGGLWLAPPVPGPLVSVTINGQPSRDFNATEAHVKTLPAEVVLVG
ncbi:Glucoamylase (glucan-1,4-alpha-glucosidase), GH15 family [Allochromatium warmingii]|uniref:Glucoamylase (Glucan-1,4-alpha-glucosidase), GH15 family n=1 Tax=Allochromatium warmingii TaxID=61595 RepID=A0A1H3G0E1_ALLWA|nr:discoidin domain-containing protein [Allochromatium warmingii]SDX95819.1 Glucoamylase (glucan-1,4-alpha-glucosidase), GH15 family [Allochromatium warmingii]